MKNLLIKNTMVLPMDGREQEKKYFSGDIAIEGNVIKEVGLNLTEKYSDYEVIDGKDTLTMPGLINCHTHAAMVLLRSYADDMELMDWLKNAIWPREAHLNADDIYWGTMLAILEMIKSGTTTFADMYFFMDQVARAVEETGIRASLCKGMIGVGEKGENDLNVSEELVKEYHGKADGRINCFLGPHAPYTCPPDYLKRVIELSDKLGVGIHIHLSETLTEVANIEKQYGLRPVQLMESIGLFENRHVVAAHCVALSEKDIEILAKHQVGIAHNPESNMKLASGVAPIPELLRKGALVGIGTDGASSNNNLDMFGEMRSCALLHKVTEMNPTVIPAYSVLEMATINGAKVLGLNNVGEIKEGNKADLIMIDLHKAHLTPLHDLAANLVYSAHGSDVKNVIIDGKLIMKDQEILSFDEERVLHEAQRLGQDLIKR